MMDFHGLILNIISDDFIHFSTRLNQTMRNRMNYHPLKWVWCQLASLAGCLMWVALHRQVNQRKGKIFDRINLNKFIRRAAGKIAKCSARYLFIFYSAQTCTRMLHSNSELFEVLWAAAALSHQIRARSSKIRIVNHWLLVGHRS